jgi:hypothetical protein
MGCVVISALVANYLRDISSKSPSAPGLQLAFLPAQVSLNYRTREMEIRGALVKEAGSPTPMQVWVWAYFINPGEGLDGSRSDESRSTTLQ